MTTQEQYIARLKEMVVAKFGREIASAEDCVLLADAVREATTQSVDHRLLELMFLAKRQRIAPRPSLLSALANYVGYSSWSDLCTSREVLPADDVDIIPVKRRWGVIILTITAIAIVIGAILFLLLVSRPADDRSNAKTLGQICSAVEERWCAIAIEECNDLRSTSDITAAEIESTIAESLATLDADIAADIATRAAARDIAIDDTTLLELTSQIVERCTNIYRCTLN